MLPHAILQSWTLTCCAVHSGGINHSLAAIIEQKVKSAGTFLVGAAKWTFVLVNYHNVDSIKGIVIICLPLCHSKPICRVCGIFMKSLYAALSIQWLGLHVHQLSEWGITRIRISLHDMGKPFQSYFYYSLRNVLLSATLYLKLQHEILN